VSGCAVQATEGSRGSSSSPPVQCCWPLAWVWARCGERVLPHLSTALTRLTRAGHVRARGDEASDDGRAPRGAAVRRPRLVARCGRRCTVRLPALLSASQRLATPFRTSQPPRHMNEVEEGAFAGQGQRLHTFSIGLKGSPDLAAAQRVADYIGTVRLAPRTLFRPPLPLHGRSLLSRPRPWSPTLAPPGAPRVRVHRGGGHRRAARRGVAH